MSIDPPRPGTYVYRVSTTGGGHIRAAWGDIEEVLVSRDGDEVVFVASTRALGMNRTRRTVERWSPDGIYVLRGTLEVNGKVVHECRRQPPTRVLPIPLVAGRLALQHWRCNGEKEGSELDVSVEDYASIDVEGKGPLKAWRVVQTDSGRTLKEQIERWFIPEFGVDGRRNVRSELKGFFGVRGTVEVSLELVETPDR